MTGEMNQVNFVFICIAVLFYKPFSAMRLCPQNSIPWFSSPIAFDFIELYSKCLLKKVRDAYVSWLKMAYTTWQIVMGWNRDFEETNALYFSIKYLNYSLIAPESLYIVLNLSGLEYSYVITAIMPNWPDRSAFCLPANLTWLLLYTNADPASWESALLTSYWLPYYTSQWSPLDLLSP